jgi:drug/metabolite transporter (DMT)-like permease
MSLGVTALVLLAALMHASWNALIKTSRDTLLDSALLVGAAAAIALPLLPLVPMPAPASWPHLLASGLVHQFYFSLVGAAYRHGDLSYAYPLMRGVPPLLVAGAGSLLLPDRAPPWLWAGVVMVSLGVLWIGGFRRMLRHAQARSTAIALGNAMLIAAYTLIDGIGVRLSGHAAGYGLWLFVLTAIPYAGIVLVRRRSTLRAHLRRRGWRAPLAAALSLGAYVIALEAMTRAPIAAVAALRETAVIFGAMIGALMLKEPFGRDRVAGACVVAAGIALMKT